MRKKKNVVT